MENKKEQTREGETGMEQVASTNFLRWNEMLQGLDPKKVAELYTKDATFLPTVSGDFKEGQVGAQEYFAHFLEKHPKGEIVEERVQPLSQDCYLHSGMYNFEVGPEDDRSVVEARFSMLWARDPQYGWQIKHHHSSVRPVK